MTITWNPDDKNANFTLSNGNLTATSLNSVHKGVRSTESKSTGKWYWEITIDALPGNEIIHVGVGTSAVSLSAAMGVSAFGWSYYGNDGKKYNNAVFTNYGDDYAVNDIIGVALDMDNGNIWWSKNGVWQDSGDPAAGTNAGFSELTGDLFAMISLYYTNAVITANFGATIFNYSVPEGFDAFEYKYSGYFSGYVNEGVSTISGATIYLFKEDDSSYQGSTTSSGDGSFYITTEWDSSHFLVCEYPTGGESYNSLIYSQMYPVTISG